MEYVIQELPERIPLGNQGEKSATIIQFNVGAWQMDYPTGAVLVASNPGIDDGLYISYTRSDYPHNVYVESPSALTLNGKILEWTPSEAVLQVAGVGTIVLHCVDDGVEKRSLMRFSYVRRDMAYQRPPRLRYTTISLNGAAWTRQRIW